MKSYKTAIFGGVIFEQASRLTAGVSQYARKMKAWETIPLHYSQENTLHQLIKKEMIDGIIGEFINDEWIKSLTKTRHIPIINTANRSQLFCSVTPDDELIGRTAAEHFISRQYPSLYFAGVRSYSCNAKRLSGFRRAAESVGIKPKVFPHANITAPLYDWIDIIESATKPMGIFCVDDHTARRVVSLCLQSKFEIPEDISIIGTGNSRIDSLFSGMGISSINIPFETIGYEAARLLNRQFTAKATTQENILIPPQGITLRDTTGAGALNTLTGRAINYMETHLEETLTIQQICDRLNVSRRMLEVQFRKDIGRSPHEQITHLRMIKARQLLLSPNSQIAEIANRCGYQETAHFYARFKQHHGGLPPGKWRRQALDSQ